MAIYNKELLLYQRVNLHFPMVFPWFFHGFPMLIYWILTSGPSPKPLPSRAFRRTAGELRAVAMDFSGETVMVFLWILPWENE